MKVFTYIAAAVAIMLAVPMMMTWERPPMELDPDWVPRNGHGADRQPEAAGGETGSNNCA